MGSVARKSLGFTSLSDWLSRAHCPIQVNLSWGESSRAYNRAMFPRGSTGQQVAVKLIVRLTLSFIVCVVTVAVTAGTAAAVTVDQIVALSKAGISEAVILALLDRDGTILSIEPDQIVALKREGLSDTLIIAMLKNGREEGEAAAREVSAFRAASVLSTLSPFPEVVIVGHGPDRPNTSWNGGFSGPRGVGFTVPVAIPYGGYGYGDYVAPIGRGHRKFTPSRFDAPRFDPPRLHSSRSDSHTARVEAEPTLCLAQVRAGVGSALSYVTACPGPIQRALGRAR